MCLLIQDSKRWRSCFSAIGIRYQEGQGFKTQLGIIFSIVTDAGKSLWYIVFFPIVNLLVLTSRRDLWLMPVHTGLGCHLQPTTPSPSQAASVRGEPAMAGWYTHYNLLKDMEKRSGPRADARVIFKHPCMDGNALKLASVFLGRATPHWMQFIPDISQIVLCLCSL